MLIGLHGKAGSGKDQSFAFIKEWAQERYPELPVRRDAFADRLKVSATRALGYDGTPEECVAIGNKIKQPGWNIVVIEPGGQIEHPISGREYLQRYGTEAHRQVFGEDFWIDAVSDAYRYTEELLVITDVRFLNEAEAVLDAGGEVWHVVRPLYGIAEDHHASERPLPSEVITRVIGNVSDLPYLRNLVYKTLDLVYA